MEDIAFLAQDPVYPAKLDFIPVQRDRLAILSYLKKTVSTSVLFVHSEPLNPAPIPSLKPKPIECIDLDDVRNDIVEIRKEKQRFSATNKDARDIIEKRSAVPTGQEVTWTE